MHYITNLIKSLHILFFYSLLFLFLFHCRVPTVNDDIQCIIKISNFLIPGEFKVHQIFSVSKAGSGGWTCEVELRGNAAEDPMYKMKLQLARRLPWGSTLNAAGDWSHLQSEHSSPSGAAQDAGGDATNQLIPPAETVRHNAAAKEQERGSMDSVPVLPDTAQKMRYHVLERAAFVSPRTTHLRPTHLDMEKGLAAAAAPVAMMMTAAAATRRDSFTSSLGSLGLRGPTASPAAQAAAEGMLGPLYLGGSAQPPASVERYLSAAASPLLLF